MNWSAIADILKANGYRPTLVTRRSFSGSEVVGVELPFEWLPLDGNLKKVSALIPTFKVYSDENDLVIRIEKKGI